MTTLDDKILGEKPQYYYSSSEDEGSDDEEGQSKIIRDGNAEEPEIDYSVDGSSVNTGGNLCPHLLLLAYFHQIHIKEEKNGKGKKKLCNIRK